MTKSDDAILLKQLCEQDSEPTLNSKKGAPNEKTKLVNDDKNEFSKEEAEKLRIISLAVAWISALVLIGLGIAALVVGITEESSASYALALDTMMDALTSFVMIWRFCGSTATVYSEKKERIACIVLGILFILSSISSSIKCVIAVAQRDFPSKDKLIWQITVGIPVSALPLAVAFFILGKKLKSRTLLIDAISLLVTFVIGLSVLTSSLLYQKYTDIWMLDPITGLSCALFLLIYGIKILYGNWRPNKEEEEENKA